MLIDKETIHYIIVYFSHLMTDDEKLALKYKMFIHKTSDNPEMKKTLTEQDWISSNPEGSPLLQNSYDEFKLKIVQRIMSEVPEKIFFNNCPQCNRLSRTPFAKQCRYCGYSWHHVTAKFKIDSVFQLTGRGFYLLGEIIEGEVNPGQLIDLKVLGINNDIKIKSIELADKQSNGEPWNGIGLAINELTGEDMQHLKQICSLHPVINIINPL